MPLSSIPFAALACRLAQSWWQVLPLLAGLSHAAGFDDTNQTQCRDSTGAAISCATAPAPSADHYAAATAGTLTRNGVGRTGFDFTKIANGGSVLAAGATLGSNPTDWACTRDNVTGLTWEVKTAGATDLRYSGHVYSWYSTGAASTGSTGSTGSDTCSTTLPAGRCNTAAYVAAVNASVLCGYTDWRLPTLRELKSLVDFNTWGKGVPNIDPSYFPNTSSYRYWSATSTVDDPAYAWFVNFDGGYALVYNKHKLSYVRLVRGGK